MQESTGMDAEKKQEFTRRISQSNRSGLVVIMYEILEEYLTDAEKAHEEGKYEEFKEAIHHGDRVLLELSEILNFTYGLATQLYALYNFSRRALMMSIVKNDTQGILDTRRVLAPLHTAFEKVAEGDTSEPLMHNTQQVYAGMTYGKENLTESFQELDTSRGFFA